MAFYTVNTSEQAITDTNTGVSKYINKGGMYPLTLKKVVVNTSASGSTSLDFLVECNEQEQPIFTAIRLTNKDGKANFQAALFDKLMVIAGIDTVDDPVEHTFAWGKNSNAEARPVLEDFIDAEVIAHIRMEYSVWNDKIQEKKVIKNFFRTSDNATASEIINNSDSVGKQYQKELEDCEKPIFRNGLTEEDVKKWKASFSKKQESTTVGSEDKLSAFEQTSSPFDD